MKMLVNCFRRSIYAQETQVSKIKRDFSDALCSEMEAASVGHTCYKFGIPFIITRSLSDVMVMVNLLCNLMNI